ncbi:DUF1937 family protein, partial [Propionibacterium freudenreichii]|uniref:DUF1937 family protein n=1 Tax=Propionibacterium freudenreichii TaxID=1744 RepID=UPI003851B97D
GDLPTDWEFWAAYDEAILSSCISLIVLPLDGWQESKGVSAEINIARRMGLPVYRYVDLLDGNYKLENL